MSQEEELLLEQSKENYEFQTEVNRMMDIIINSLYKHKEVFLREIISNASDALDKLRFLAVSKSELLDNFKDMAIWIHYDEDAKTITIRDSGIGMTKQELINNLGTLAKSGTKKFMENIDNAADPMGLIGQFGVGFYSVYLVADRVRVVSKSVEEDDQHVWESNASNNFTVSKDPRGNTLKRGTEITLYLKDDASEFLNQSRLEEIITKHSEFITFPIYLYKKNVEVVEKTEDEVEVEKSEDDLEVKDDEEEVEDEEKKVTEEDAKKEKKTETKTTWEYARMNSNVAIWSRNKDEITEEEYQNFFKVISKQQTDDAATWIHFKAEGEIEFKGLLYVPTHANDLYDEYNNKDVGIRLYVRKVLIQDNFENLLPRYLNFVSGVVDSEDLPLNVSRETLQQHRLLKIMGKKLTRKVLEMLRKLSQGKTGKEDTFNDDEDEENETTELAYNDPEHPYTKFWNEFGKSIKLGILEDTPNRVKLAKLLRFKSSKHDDDTIISLDDYIENKPEWQKDIYYIAAESIEAAKKSPFMEIANKKNVNVLYMVDPIDEYFIQQLGEYEGYKFQSLTKEGLKFNDDEEDEEKKKTKLKLYREAYKGLIKHMKNALNNKVVKVNISQRIVSLPAVIVTSQFGHTANMERIMRAQTLSNPELIKSLAATKTLEINPKHPIIVELNALYNEVSKAEKTKEEEGLDEEESEELVNKKEKLDQMINALYDVSLFASGFIHDDLEAFTSRFTKIIGENLNLKSLELVEDLPLVDESDDEEDKKQKLEEEKQKLDDEFELEDFHQEL